MVRMVHEYATKFISKIHLSYLSTYEAREKQTENTFLDLLARKTLSSVYN